MCGFEDPSLQRRSIERARPGASNEHRAPAKVSEAANIALGFGAAQVTRLVRSATHEIEEGVLGRQQRRQFQDMSEPDSRFEIARRA